MQVFVEKGYANTRIDDIAEKVSLSKGAIYHHFPSKKELFLCLIAHWETLTFPNFYDNKNKDMSATNTLQYFSDTIIDVYTKRKYVFLAESEFLSLANQDPDFKMEIQKLYDKLLNLFELVIAKGIRLGEFGLVDTKNTSLLLLSGFQTINWMSVFRPDLDDISGYMKEFINAIIKNIKIGK